MLRTLFAASLLLLAACSAETSASGPVLRFTAIPDSNSTELEQKLRPVAEYLSKELGVDVEYVPSVDYSASVASFKNADVQLAWFGGLSGCQARAAVPGARAIAQGVVDPEYKSYFIAHSSTGLTKSDEFPAELEGMNFTFGSNSSTSGRLMPEHFIRQNTGKSPAEFFGREPNFSGAHDKTAKLVEAGTFQAGALNYKTYDRMVKEGKLDPEQCRLIWVTPTYADYNFTAHPELEERFGAGFIDKLQAALVGIKDPALLSALDRPAGLIKAENEDFDQIGELATQLNLLR